MSDLPIFTEGRSPDHWEGLHIFLGALYVCLPIMMVIVAAPSVDHEGLAAYCKANSDVLSNLYLPAKIIAFSRPIPVCTTSFAIWMDFLYFLGGVWLIYSIAKAILQIVVLGPFGTTVHVPPVAPRSAEQFPWNNATAMCAGFVVTYLMVCADGSFWLTALSSERYAYVTSYAGWVLTAFVFSTLMYCGGKAVPASLIFSCRLYKVVTRGPFR